MPKKRVYELAKELGLESKILIARLEEIGIPVKTASASLEEDVVERIKKELLAGELREVVEERIKSTVIRRRTVRTPIEVPIEEAPPVEKKEDIQAKDLAEDKLQKTPSIQPSEKVDKVKKETHPETPTPKQEEVVPEQPKEKILKVEIKEESSAGPAPVAEAPVVEKIKQPPTVSVKPAIISKHKITRPETDRPTPQKGAYETRRKNIYTPVRKAEKEGQTPG